MIKDSKRTKQAVNIWRIKIFNFFFRNFRTKVTLAFIGSMLFVGFFSNFLIYRFMLNSQFEDLRNKLMLVAQTASLMVDGQTIKEVPLEKDGVFSPQYKTIAQVLQKIKSVNPTITYIYTLTKTAEEGIWQFIVDPEPVSKDGKSRYLSSWPGEKYRAYRFPEMLKAYDGPSADRKLEVDEWGITLSGYAPIRDREGHTVAVLGVDIKAEQVYLLQQAVRKRVLFVLGLGVLISIFLGMIISQRITYPLKKLVEGTGHISEGELSYRVQVFGDDEISELARSFNRMSKALFISRKKLLNYFFRVVQSFVRILEAKDNYTRGHSERVSEYAQMIALEMGFLQEKVDLLKDAALLHDIGKLGVKESVLNKKERLSEEEWEEIKKHPIIGEEILRPVLLTKEMLTIVRGHHERYDSKGYPDKINGENLNIFAAIVSVADAYDAMTSPRAYRAALSKEYAIAEIKAGSGSQFNPKVVKAFLQVLNKTNSL